VESYQVKSSKVMKIEKFEDIIAWKKAEELTVAIYSQLKGCRDFGFRDQIQRALVSIMNNIAEGFERRTNKEFINFLYIAKGSSGEVRSMLSLALKFKYITQEHFDADYNLIIEISKLLSGFIKSL
jgi:four helix bundle protein